MRKPMVRRTVNYTEVIALCADLNDNKIFEETVTIPRKIKNSRDLHKELNRIFNTDTVKYIGYKAINYYTKIYAMTEEHFIENSAEIKINEQQNINL